MTLVVKTPEDLVCMVPFILGYEPHDRLCVIPFGHGQPYAAVEHPHTGDALLEVAASMGAAYRHHPGPVALVSYTDQVDHALDAFAAVTAILDGFCDVQMAVVAKTTGEWFTTAREAGHVTDATRARIAAEFAVMGRPAPSPSREARREVIAQDPERVAALRPHLRGASPEAGGREAAGWVREQFVTFTYEPRLIDDATAARLVLAVQDEEVRRVLVDDMNRDSAVYQAPLLVDLMQRTPKPWRGPVAMLTALAAWLTGDGALAWMSLDTIGPEDAADPLVAYVHAALDNATAPSEWVGAASLSVL